jgi:hypothetical protein
MRLAISSSREQALFAITSTDAIKALFWLAVLGLSNDGHKFSLGRASSYRRFHHRNAHRGESNPGCRHSREIGCVAPNKRGAGDWSVIAVRRSAQAHQWRGSRISSPSPCSTSAGATPSLTLRSMKPGARASSAWWRPARTS